MEPRRARLRQAATAYGIAIEGLIDTAFGLDAGAVPPEHRFDACLLAIRAGDFRTLARIAARGHDLHQDHDVADDLRAAVLFADTPDEALLGLVRQLLTARGGRRTAWGPLLAGRVLAGLPCSVIHPDPEARAAARVLVDEAACADGPDPLAHTWPQLARVFRLADDVLEVRALEQAARFLFGGRHRPALRIVRALALEPAIDQPFLDALVGAGRHAAACALLTGLALRTTWTVERICADALRRARGDKRAIRDVARTLAEAGLSIDVLLDALDEPLTPALFATLRRAWSARATEDPPARPPAQRRPARIGPHHPAPLPSPLVTRHALERRRRLQPQANPASVLRDLANGEIIEPALAAALLQRPLDRCADRYVLSPDGLGIYVVAAMEDRLFVPTFLRLGPTQRRILEGN